MKYIRSYFKLNIDKSENKSSEETKKRSSDSSRNINIDNELSKESKIVHENNPIEHREHSSLSAQEIDWLDDDNINDNINDNIYDDIYDDNWYNEIMLRLSIKKDKKCLRTPLKLEYLDDEINSKDFDQNDMNEIAIDYIDIEDKSKHTPFKHFMMFIEKKDN